MHISKFQLLNYKSFAEPTPVTFGPGINMVIGQNNAGKSALLEGLSLDFPTKPNYDCLQRSATPNEEDSHAIISFTLDREELLEILKEEKTFYVPVESNDELDIRRALSTRKPSIWQDPNTGELRNSNDVVDIPKKTLAFLDELLGTSDFTFEAAIGRRVNGLREVSHTIFPSLKSHIYEVVGEGDEFLSAVGANILPPDYGVSLLRFKTSKKFDFGLDVCRSLARRIYHLAAERRVNYGHPTGGGKDLRSDASNLVEVLDTWLRNSDRSARFNSLVRRIFPHIHSVSVEHEGGANQSQRPQSVLIYETPSEDPAKAIRLEDSGSGLWQMFALLYLLVSAKESRVFVLDEPQIHLHPGAFRTLLAIFEEYAHNSAYPNHQYIISTHYLPVINDLPLGSLTLMKKDRGQSTQLKSIQSMVEGWQECRDELGVKPSDFFGADKIVWVEGESEQRCFTDFRSQLLHQPLSVIFVPIHANGVSGRHGEQFVNLHKKYAEVQGVNRANAYFFLDRERRDEAELQEMIETMEGQGAFTKRPMLESYLLNAAAIHAVICAESLVSAPSRAEVEDWLAAELANPNRYQDKIVPATEDEKLAQADAAVVLRKVFARVDIIYGDEPQLLKLNKTKHCPLLMRYLLEHHPEELEELKTSLNELLFSKTEAS